MIRNIPYFSHAEHFIYWQDVFNEEELSYLQNLAKKSSETAKIGDGLINEDVRRSTLHWLDAQTNSWVYDRISLTIGRINSQFYNFNLTGMYEQIQLTNYSSQDSGTYNWHIDCGKGIVRKLSITLQLSDPSEYEGGNFQLMPFNNEIITAKKGRGLLVAFPSYTIHRVTPVTSGSRQSLVTWINGPSFK